MHGVRDGGEAYANILEQSFAISNMFLDHEEEKSWK